MNSFIANVDFLSFKAELGIVVRRGKKTRSYPIVHFVESALEFAILFSEGNCVVFKGSDANDLEVDKVHMNGMAVGQTYENPILSCSNFRIISFPVFHEVVVPVEKMNSTLLEGRLHPKLTDALSRIAHFRKGTELIYLSKIIKMQSFELH